ncbi:hypothetical protein A9264_09495 [Vibrio sp. UCD-FRSSP16_10]|uniref:hypothetical protein n=1 Tax=unclassified Vibrio TaxID=2614977 RepID=UPI000802138D|nr:MULTISPECIES: hypothetical protein [unclassified Vibrio]OBT16954.1 hypothetical protein A9260_09720 [Vibrio sp. UCD-FRSSP16_30]OBT21945.1 hypothetical protein A9264_09495 [Vibrio sp. UCD-FRSSP16_10]
MTTKAHKSQIRITIAMIVVALLSIFGHVILSPVLAKLGWVEYVAAAIPFTMMMLCIWAVKDAQKALNAESEEDDHKYD